MVAQGTNPQADCCEATPPPPAAASTCSGNTDAANDVVCDEGSQLVGESDMVAQGTNPQADCCEATPPPPPPTSFCSGNADTATDVICEAGSELVAQSDTIEPGDDAQANCCVFVLCRTPSIDGYTLASITASDGLLPAVLTAGDAFDVVGLTCDEDAGYFGASPMASTCANAGEVYRVSGCTHPVLCLSPHAIGYDISGVTATDGSAAVLTAGSEFDVIASSISCAEGYGGDSISVATCASAGEEYVVAGCVPVRVMCSGNTRASDDVRCNDRTQLIMAAAATEQGESPQSDCCEVSPPPPATFCSGNGIAAGDIVCDEGTQLVDESDTIEPGGDAQVTCCEVSILCTRPSTDGFDLSDAIESSLGSSTFDVRCE